MLLAIFSTSIIGIPVLLGLTYLLSSRFLTTEPPTPPPPPRDLCAAVGKERIAELVREPVVTSDHSSRGDIVGCSAETDSDASGYDALTVQLSRSAPIGSRAAEEVASRGIDESCQELAKTKMPPGGAKVPMPGLDTVGDRRCAWAAYGASEKTGNLEIYAVRGPDILHIRYDPSQTDDTTPQRLLVAFARDVLAKTDPAGQ
ncbi:hypothetical protein ABN028_18385 [Actinopolymorpha sp. B17G11]|uniref:hypothetical protein n=1 Tax=unclassified Actinopolymorpha TaxID=2627063 RepID=UPI0032D9916A